MMSKSNICIVIFPVYKKLEILDQKILMNAIKKTEGFEKVFIAPQSFVFDESFKEFGDLRIFRFDDIYFRNIEGYNRLMLSEEFYKAFSQYKYILIHQTDAYIFKPELEFWCNKDYDYIGAPWFKPHKLEKTKIYNLLMAVFPFLYSNKAKRRHQVYNNVGNGGFSLRKTSAFLNILSKTSTKLIDQYRDINQTDFNEDVFWGVEAPRIDKHFKKPKWKEALLFSFEEYPSIAYNKNNNQLPFGCHAFDVHDTEFWKQHIPELSE